ncbi:MAG: hypothetical protein ACI94Y_001511 [Maribacter sp.]|jgi:hypothetical protein
MDKAIKWKLELVWWIFTAVVCVAVLYPIISKVSGYEFLIPNIVFVVVFITAIRHIFLLKHSLIANRKILNIVLIVVCIPIIAYLLQHITDFQTSLDNLDVTGWDVVFGDQTLGKQDEIRKYMRAEMLFFGTGAVISTFLFPLRMILSIWRQWNKGTV